MCESHPPAGRFVFSEARNTAVCICERVADGAPILYVTHDGNGDWQFLCGGNDHEGEDKTKLVCLEHVVEHDPSLNELAKMCINHRAERASAASPWNVVDEGEEFIERQVREGGWAVELISDGKTELEPAFAYTVGLFRNFKHAELIVFGQQNEVMHFILNELGDRIRSGKPLSPGDRVADVLDGYDVLIREVKAPESYREHVGYARWFHKGAHFPLYQVVWPDKQGRFPGEPGAAEILKTRQPLPP